MKERNNGGVEGAGRDKVKEGSKGIERVRVGQREILGGKVPDTGIDRRRKREFVPYLLPQSHGRIQANVKNHAAAKSAFRHEAQDPLLQPTGTALLGS